MSDLKARILQAVQPDLDAIETALAEKLNPFSDFLIPFSILYIES